VVDCIADPFERDAALLEAWNLTKAYLVVNVRRDNCKKEIPFGDGYLTRWRTFQKGFTQPEFFAWIFKILDEEPFEYDRGGCVLVPKSDKWRYAFRDFDFKKHLPHRGIPRKELAGCPE